MSIPVKESIEIYRNALNFSIFFIAKPEGGDIYYTGDPVNPKDVPALINVIERVIYEEADKEAPTFENLVMMKDENNDSV